MLEKELTQYIKTKYPLENESCEWKEYSSLNHSVKGREGNDIVSYISGISNMEGGVLIIGVNDTTGEIAGIQDFHHYTAENMKIRLAEQIINLPVEGLNIEQITTSDTNRTIWIIHIPKHSPRRIVYAQKTAWQRAGDSLIKITPEREDAILNEPLTITRDWSAETVPNANLADLDPEAIAKARHMYSIKNPRIKEEIKAWDDVTFLNNAKVTIKGHITYAALILLGKDVSEALLSPFQARIMWALQDKENNIKDYQSFTCPMIMSVDSVYSKIRNIRYRYMNDSTIFPEELDLYDSGLIREALHNCIAHQDYQMRGRINVVENEDGYLIFSNPGTFLPGSIESILYANTPPDYYRNPLLANAMVSLNMIDTVGGGIKRMFDAQRRRLFPMPEYDLSHSKVEVKVIGKVLDDTFAELLLEHLDLNIVEIYLLDKVQKKKSLSYEETRILKAKRLIEGRKPNFYLSKPLSVITGQKMRYSKNKGLKKAQYLEMIMKAIDEHKSLSRKDIDDLLLDILPSILTMKQKQSCIHHYLSELRISGKIVNVGSKHYPAWVRNRS